MNLTEQEIIDISKKSKIEKDIILFYIKNKPVHLYAKN